MQQKELTEEEFKKIAQLTANIIINWWLPRWREWQKTNGK